jgi:outer membrane receptor protein involved in Fe transport
VGPTFFGNNKIRSVVRRSCHVTFVERGLPLALLLSIAGLSFEVHAQDQAAPATPAEAGEAASGVQTLQAIDVTATGVSQMNAASMGDVTQNEIQNEPLLRPAAVLENVPGLIVTQHSGEGKANQYFMRAFNLDHGTDLAVQLDDMPINMPTHGHGQGYLDLNFLIPELVADLHYKKGPYYADEGDFATAGAVRIGLLNQVDPSVSLGFGEDGYRRTLAVGSNNIGNGRLISALEVYHNDGPYDVPDDYNRLNGMLRYHSGTDNDFFTATLMGYDGRWNSTDQVPQRAIDSGLIGRFGSLAPTDGGTTRRSSLSINRFKQTASDQEQFSAYVIRYKFDLWSTFTYDLTSTTQVNPNNSDQIHQNDDRLVYGFKGSKTWFTEVGGFSMSNLLGMQVRIDDIKNVGIDQTIRRQFQAVNQAARVMESNGAVYFENSTSWKPSVRTVLGLREDAFTFDVTDKLTNPDGTCNTSTDPLGCDTGTRRATIFSPKFGLILGPWADTTYFLNVAEGYHSNDARGITRSGENPDIQPATPLVRAKSAEIGLTSRPIPQWEAGVDVFMLKLASELVFAGDAGVTEPSGATTRTGIEISNKFYFTDWLTGDLNGAFTRGRFDKSTEPDDVGCADGAAAGFPCVNPPAYVGRYIPNSPTRVIDFGLTAQSPAGWFSSLRGRHFGESPLTEDNSVKAPSYTTFDLALGYQQAKEWRFVLDVFNLFDKKWNDITYYYATRLSGEPNSQPDLVVHPGVPRTLRGTFTYFF